MISNADTLHGVSAYLTVPSRIAKYEKLCACHITIGFSGLSAHAAAEDASVTLNVTGRVTQHVGTTRSVLLSQNTFQVAKRTSDVVDRETTNTRGRAPSLPLMSLMERNIFR